MQGQLFLFPSMPLPLQREGLTGGETAARNRQIELWLGFGILWFGGDSLSVCTLCLSVCTMCADVCLTL